MWLRYRIKYYLNPREEEEFEDPRSSTNNEEEHKSKQRKGEEEAEKMMDSIEPFINEMSEVLENQIANV